MIMIIKQYIHTTRKLLDGYGEMQMKSKGNRRKLIQADRKHLIACLLEEEMVEAVGVSELQLVGQDARVVEPSQSLQVNLRTVPHILLQTSIRRPAICMYNIHDRPQG